MLRIFKNNTPFTVILLFIFALLVKLRVLLWPAVPVPVPGHYLYNYLLKGLSFLLGNGAFSYTLLAVIILFVQSLYLNNITIRHKLFPRNTYISSFVYLLLTTAYPRFNFFSETLIVNWLLLGAMDIMFGFSKTTQPRKLIYNAALLLSLAAIFQFTMLAYFMLLVVGMVLFRPFNTGEWSVALLGYTTPFYFLVSVLFLADRLFLFGHWPHVGFSVEPLAMSTIYFIITISGFFILMLSGLFAMQKNVAMTNIYIRRDWTAVSFYLIISVMVAFATDKTVASAWLITLPALSIIVTHSLALEKNKRFSNFIFYFSLIFLIFCLWANK